VFNFSIGDGEAANYAADFVHAFNSFGIKTAGPDFLKIKIGVVGTQIFVHDLSHPPPQAELFAEHFAIQFRAYSSDAEMDASDGSKG
jgi:hypothetical protein